MGLHLKPGQKGTKQLLDLYGERLICVRYRYDAEQKKRLKTAEIVVGERPWEPPPPRILEDALVGLRVGFAEAGVRARLKRAGATWDAELRLWQPRYDRVVALGLRDRIVHAPASNSRCRASAGEHLQVDADSPST